MSTIKYSYRSETALSFDSDLTYEYNGGGGKTKVSLVISAVRGACITSLDPEPELTTLGSAEATHLFNTLIALGEQAKLMLAAHTASEDHERQQRLIDIDRNLDLIVENLNSREQRC